MRFQFAIKCKTVFTGWPYGYVCFCSLLMAGPFFHSALICCTVAISNVSPQSTWSALRSQYGCCEVLCSRSSACARVRSCKFLACPYRYNDDMRIWIHCEKKRWYIQILSLSLATIRIKWIETSSSVCLYGRGFSFSCSPPNWGEQRNSYANVSQSFHLYANIFIIIPHACGPWF